MLGDESGMEPSLPWHGKDDFPAEEINRLCLKGFVFECYMEKKMKNL